MPNVDFAEIAALFDVTAEPTIGQQVGGQALRDLSACEIAGIGGGEGVSMWG